MAQKRPRRTLTNAQTEYLRARIEGLSCLESARRTGSKAPYRYAEKTEQLPAIQEALAAARKRLIEKSEVTAERVMREYACIGFADIRELMTWDEQTSCFVPSKDLTDEQARAVQSVKTKTRHIYRDNELTETVHEMEIKCHDKKGALDSMGKHLGMFVDRTDITTGGQPMKFYAFDPDATEQ